MATEATVLLTSSTDDGASDIADIVTGGIPYCDSNKSDTTVWIILFVLSLIAFLISSVINIVLCCRIRGKELKISKILLLCKRRNYDIEKNEYSAVPTKVPVDKTLTCGTVQQTESDYEMPMSINAKIARSFTFPRTALEAESKPCNDSGLVKVPETTVSTDNDIPTGSVKAKRRIFETGDKNANLSGSVSSLNAIKPNLEDISRSCSKASGLDVVKDADGDSAPEDMAPAPYEMIHFRKNSRKGKRDLNKTPQTERSADKVHSTVIIQKDGTMEIKVADSDDDGEGRKSSIPENEPPPLPYDRISYPTRKKEKQKCRVM